MSLGGGRDCPEPQGADGPAGVDRGGPLEDSSGAAQLPRGGVPICPGSNSGRQRTVPPARALQGRRRLSDRTDAAGAARRCADARQEQAGRC